MLGFFRRIINSKAGIVVTFAVLGVIALAFAAGDVTGLSSGGGGITGGSVATVGDAKITSADLRARVQSEYENFRQQQPTLDVASFVNNGGLDGTLQRYIGSVAIEEFGRAQGMVISKRLIDGQIAGIPGLRGLDGKFDPNIYRQLLQQRKLTDAQVRTDIARDTMLQQLLAPTQGASQVPEQLALPYASLLLERRAGQVAVIPASAVGGGTPSDADVQTFYRRNLQRYSLPERRVARYALIGPDQVRAAATPSDAEIAQAYQQNRATYAARETRSVEQVVVLDQTAATALANRVRGGASLADAARAAGLQTSNQTAVAKAAYAGLTSPAAADAVFAAQRGAVVGPVRGQFGFVVARVTDVQQIAARSLDQVRGEIAASLAKQKQADALSTLQNEINDSLAGNATFDEVVNDRKLSAQTTPALAAGGIDPLNPAATPNPALAPIMQAAFASNEGDAPQIVAIGQDGGFAVVGVGRILPAAPRPLAEVRAAVARDAAADRARQAARRIAAQIVARVNGGATLAQAVAQAGTGLPAPRPLSGQRADLVAQRARPGQEALPLLFGIKQGAARLAPAPDGSGYVVVRLDRIDRGDAGRNPAVVRAARNDFGRIIGSEYAAQFARAARDAVGVRTDTGAIAQVRADLTGANNN